MSDAEADRRLTFFRQRRFLFLISIAIIAYYTLGVSVKSEADYNGFLLKLANPNRAIIGLWIIWIWALWRYWVCVYESLSTVKREILEDVFAEDRRIMMAKAKKRGNALAASGELSDKMPKTARIYGDVKTTHLDSETISRFAAAGVNSVPDSMPTKEGGRNFPALLADFTWRDGTAIGSGNQRFDMTLTRKQTKWVRVRAWFHAFTRLPALSEHVAPFVIAVAAVGTGVYSYCQSNTPAVLAREYEQILIRTCWDRQERKSLAPADARSVAGHCERLEEEYWKKWLSNP